jgi:hypothetical protein
MDAAGRNVSVFRRHYQAWGDLVFAYPNGWKQTGTAVTDQTALDHLENLADRLVDIVPAVRAGGLDDIREYAYASCSTRTTRLISCSRCMSNR